MNYLQTSKTIIAIMSALTLFSNAQAVETGSSHNLFILKQLSERSYFVGRANLATRDGFSDTFFGYVDGNYRHTLTGPWSVEAGYRHVNLELTSGWRQEYRPMFALNWRGKLGQNRFSNRNRLELRYYEGDAKDRIRYRNESVWTSSQKFTALQLAPFFEEEFFYDLTDKKLNTNWLTFGVSKHWKKGAKWKLGYRIQSQEFNDEWEHRHVLVTGFSFTSFK